MGVKEPLELVNECDGFVWPASDRECRRFVVAWMEDLNVSLPLCENRRVAVQAGGNVGTWPLALADEFDTVYTFEPDPLNFYCLARNCANPNIIKFQAALGNERGLVGMHTDPRNVGAHYIEGSGRIPIMRIDDLGLEVCDFICLDIEGYEMEALKGAHETLLRHHPVIHLEDKGLSEKYGTKKEEVVDMLVNLYGYTVRARVHRDVILS